MISHLKWIVTGSPRSATRYMHKLFTLAGISCGHEYEFSDTRKFLDKMPENKRYQAESAWQAGCHLDWIKRDFPHIKIIHIVRDPLKVISSQMNTNPPNGYFKKPEIAGAYMYMQNHCPYLNSPSLTNLDKYLWFYIYWNTIIDKKQDVRLRVEDVSLNPRGFLEEIGVPVKENAELPGNTMVNTYNLDKRKYLSVKDIKESQFFDDFILLRRSYGYKD